MAQNHLFSNSELLKYLRQFSLRESETQKALRDQTNKLEESSWAVVPEQAQFLALLAKIINAKMILEVGTFTGVSSLAMALAIEKDCKIITCDMETKYTDIAQRYWAEAKVDDKIELIIGPALSTLESLLDKYLEKFDLIFIDANKKDYGSYYEFAYQLVRKHGLIIFDNVLWDGKVINPNNNEKSTVAIQRLNSKLLHDDRVSISMLPINDGITIAYKN